MEYNTEDITFIIKDLSEREHEDDERDSEINGFVLFCLLFPDDRTGPKYSTLELSTDTRN